MYFESDRDQIRTDTSNDTTPSRWRVYQFLHTAVNLTYCDPTGARTQDPNIKSVVLYQLSYRVNKKISYVEINSNL